MQRSTFSTTGVPPSLKSITLSYLNTVHNPLSWWFLKKNNSLFFRILWQVNGSLSSYSIPKLFYSVSLKSENTFEKLSFLVREKLFFFFFFNLNKVCNYQNELSTTCSVGYPYTEKEKKNKTIFFLLQFRTFYKHKKSEYFWALPIFLLLSPSVRVSFSCSLLTIQLRYFELFEVIICENKLSELESIQRGGQVAGSFLINVTPINSAFWIGVIAVGYQFPMCRSWSTFGSGCIVPGQTEWSTPSHYYLRKCPLGSHPPPLVGSINPLVLQIELKLNRFLDFN